MRVCVHVVVSNTYYCFNLGPPLLNQLTCYRNAKTMGSLTNPVALSPSPAQANHAEVFTANIVLGSEDFTDVRKLFQFRSFFVCFLQLVNEMN